MGTDLAELVSIDPDVMHGQAVLRGTRIPVAVVLDCLAAGVSEEAIQAQYPTLPEGSIKASLAYAAALAREEIVPLEPHPRVRIKLDENLPADAVGVLVDLGHDVDTVVKEELGGAHDPAVVVAATRAERLLITLDRGLGDIRSYPPGTHAGIVVLRVDDQSAPALVDTLRALAENHDLEGFKGCVVVVRQHLVRIRRPQ